VRNQPLIYAANFRRQRHAAVRAAAFGTMPAWQSLLESLVLVLHQHRVQVGLIDWDKSGLLT
jgi:hypothetical protein